MPFIFPIMTATLTIDKAGRVVIPKRLRDKLRLAAGDSFQMESTEEEIVLRPVRNEERFCKEDGIWVFRAGKPLTVADTDTVLQALRNERDARNLGLK